MKSRIQAVLVISALAASLSACSYSKRFKHPGDRIQMPTGDDVNSETQPTGIPSFAKVKREVLEPKCFGCHNHTKWFSTYAGTYSRRDKIMEDVVNGVMPKAESEGGPLTAAQFKMLVSWIKAGAPENGSAPSDPGSTTSTTTTTSTTMTTSSSTPTTSSTVPSTTVPSTLAAVSFKTVQAQVIGPSCMKCHDELSTYAGVYSELEDVYQQTIVEKVMPKKKPLTDAQYSLLKSWIDSGAPEYGQDNPPPASPTITASYESIRRLVIEKRCIGCHMAGSRASKVPLANYEDLTTGRSPKVVPGQPDASLLYQVLSTSSDDRMPPEGAGPRLSQEELDAVRAWIGAGAPRD